MNSTLKNNNTNEPLIIEIRACFAIIMTMFIFITIFGNSLVMISVFRFSKLRSQMCFRLLCSLAASDICVAVLVMPASTISFLTAKWIFGKFACYFWMSSDVMCCTASILHLFLVAMDRYIAISRPLRYSRIVTHSRILTSISATWSLSLLISFVPIFSNWFAPANWDYIITDSCDLEVNKTYSLISSFTSFYIPFLAILIIYIKIYNIAQNQVKKMRIEESRSNLKKSKNDRKAIRTLGLIVGLFSLCWFPFFIMYVTRSFCAHCNLRNEWVLFITWIGYINSSFNPIVYCFIQKEFRNSFIRLICSYSICRGFRNEISSSLSRDQQLNMNNNFHNNMSIDESSIRNNNSNTNRNTSLNSY